MEPAPFTLESMIWNQNEKMVYQRPMKMVEPEKFPLVLGGGVGDVIMAIPFAEAMAELGPLEVYTPHPAVFNYFKTGSLPNAIGPMGGVAMPNYTWFLELNTVARFRLNDEFSSFNNKTAKALRRNQTELLRANPTLNSLVRYHPHLDAALARYARALGLDRRSFPFHSLGLPAQKMKKRERTNGDAGIITIHDGFESALAPFIQDRATKMWSLDHWRELVRLLKAELPQFKIVQLGGATSCPIEGVDVNLVNQTTITEAFGMISGSVIHIDGDSGLVHAATALSVPCVVLFGPTPDYFYGYPENANLRAGTCSDACYWMKPDWLNRCPLGFEAPKCMDDIGPEEAMEAVRELLSRT
jgi:ADP-heptose:LPS heptosyltransferase